MGYRNIGLYDITYNAGLFGFLSKIICAALKQLLVSKKSVKKYVNMKIIFNCSENDYEF